MLAATFLEHHPQAGVAALVVDDVDGHVAGEPFEVVRPADVDLAPAELARMASMYDGLELSCALKPWIVEHALGRGADAVLYLDADMEVHAPLGVAAELAGTGRIVVTPHQTAPPPQSEAFERDRIALAGGTFNGGFVAVGQERRDFVGWWKERLARHCLDAMDEGFFVDQRWLDLVPALFEYAVVRDPGWDAAFWNLDTRTASFDASGYRIDGSPLAFFHFSGFDPHRPYLLSTWLLPSPAVLLSESPALLRLSRDHARRLLESGWDEARATPYGYATAAGGDPLERSTRRRYREALLQAERTGEPEPPPLIIA